MRVLNVFSFLLIAGILSFAIADEEILEPPRRLPPHLKFLGYVNTTITDVDKYDEDMCTRNGGPGAFTTHMSNWEAWENCLETASDIGRGGNIAEGDNGSGSESGVTNVTHEQRYCGTVPMLENCLNNVRTSLKNCLDPDKKEAADVLYNVTTSVMHFMCEDGAARLKNLMQFTDASESPCLESKRQALSNCANQSMSDYVKSKISDGASIGGIGMAQWLIPDVEKCTVMENFRTCYVNELNDCPPPTPGDLVDSIFDHVKTVTNCNIPIPQPLHTPAKFRERVRNG